MAKAKNASESSSAIKKHVALEHLYIIKDYIDKQTDKTISSAEGFHGIRYYNGKLQAKDADTGNWVNVATGGTSGGSGIIDSDSIADNKDVEDLFK